MSAGPSPDGAWAAGDAYESYVGRWSRLVAEEFIALLGVGEGGRWLDVGCGTGALTGTILELARPSSVTGVDTSDAFVAHAAGRFPQAEFRAGDAQSLPFHDTQFDAAVSGLVLNFVPDPAAALAEMIRVVVPGGTVGFYVWDYAGAMQLMRYFWDAAVALDPAAGDLDEGVRFPLCQPAPLLRMLVPLGLDQLEVRAIDVHTHFRDFEDYWTPFLGGQGPAPAYCVSLSDGAREALRQRLLETLPFAANGAIHLRARAFAAHGRKPR